MNNPPSLGRRLPRGVKRLLWALLVLLALFGGLSYWASLNPLPRDEEMIAHFRAHRSEIEELIRRFRAFTPFPGGDHGRWLQEPGTQELFRKAGVEDVNNTVVPWLPNPYSVETAKELEAGQGLEVFRRHGGMRVRLADPRYFTVSFFYNDHVWKDLHFIPELPRVEQGYLMGPVDLHGDSRRLYRVLPELNNYPPDWQIAECVLRQLEPQWFIRMCRS